MNNESLHRKSFITMNHQGCIHLYTGNGKGKSTASIGLCVRMMGYGHCVLFTQFLKSMNSGEIDFFQYHQNLITVYRPMMRNKAFIWNQTPEQKAETAEDLYNGWLKVVEQLKDPAIRLFIFDELLDVIEMGFIKEEEVAEALNSRHSDAEIVLTGRNAPEALLSMADYVTQMELVKHPYAKGLQARRGIEY